MQRYNSIGCSGLRNVPQAAFHAVSIDRSREKGLDVRFGQWERGKEMGDGRGSDRLNQDLTGFCLFILRGLDTLLAEEKEL